MARSNDYPVPPPAMAVMTARTVGQQLIARRVHLAALCDLADEAVDHRRILQQALDHPCVLDSNDIAKVMTHTVPVDHQVASQGAINERASAHSFDNGVEASAVGKQACSHQRIADPQSLANKGIYSLPSMRPVRG